jgi:DNA adenine methylase
MRQLTLWDTPTNPEHIVNVASVPLRSPFRYPGGKTWLVPYIRRWLSSLSSPPTEFIEPFAGGGIVSLTVAAEWLADHITMVELDEQVATVWQAILDAEDSEWLGQQIVCFNPTPDAIRAALARPAIEPLERAFQTILKNRVNRGGILAHGAGMVKNGEAGKGLISRWYPVTLRKRISEIAAMRSRITFIQGDGLAVMAAHISAVDTAFFIDPPYTVAGKRAGNRLYTHNDIDHEKLFALAAEVAGSVLLTYDDTEEVRSLAHRYGFTTQAVAMKNTHHERMHELLIGRNLDWLSYTAPTSSMGAD